MYLRISIEAPPDTFIETRLLPLESIARNRVVVKRIVSIEVFGKALSTEIVDDCFDPGPTIDPALDEVARKLDAVIARASEDIASPSNGSVRWILNVAFIRTL